MHRVNWWAIVVSAIVFFLLGWLWYGVLFRNAWLAAVGNTQAQMPAASATLYPFVVSIFMAFFLAYGLARILSWRGDYTPWRGAFIGISTGLLFFGTMTWMDYAYEMRGVALGLINVGYVVVGMGIIGLMLGAWPPRKA